MRAGVIRMLAVLGMMVVALAGCGDLRESQGRVTVDDSYAQAAGVRLSLPVAVPGDYKLTKFWSVANSYDEHGKFSSLARSAQFVGPDATVRVCTEIVDVPGDLCPASNVGISVEKDGLLRTVYVESGSLDIAAAWGDEVGYSELPDDWAWLTT